MQGCRYLQADRGGTSDNSVISVAPFRFLGRRIGSKGGGHSAAAVPDIRTDTDFGGPASFPCRRRLPPGCDFLLEFGNPLFVFPGEILILVGIVVEPEQLR